MHFFFFFFWTGKSHHARYMSSPFLLSFLTPLPLSSLPPHHISAIRLRWALLAAAWWAALCALCASAAATSSAAAASHASSEGTPGEEWRGTCEE